MGTYTVQAVNRTGITPTQNAVAASDTFPNDGHTILIVENGSGDAITVTVVTPGTVDGLAVTDLTATIADGFFEAIGPFPTNIYNNSSGAVTVQYSATTSVTAMVLSI